MVLTFRSTTPEARTIVEQQSDGRQRVAIATRNHTASNYWELVVAHPSGERFNARVTYMNIAWSNRMGSPSTNEKQALLDEVDRQLVEFRVPDEERRRIVKPVVQMLKYDLYLGFQRIISAYAGIR